MKRILYFPLLLLFCIYMSNCSGDQQYENLSDKNQKFKGELQMLFDDSQVILNKDTFLIDQQLKSYYISRGYASLWFNNNRLTPFGDTLLSILETSNLYGLPEDFYKGTLIRTLPLIQQEYWITLMLSQFLEHHHNGIFNEDKTGVKPLQFYEEHINTIEELTLSPWKKAVKTSSKGGIFVFQLLEKWAPYSKEFPPKELVLEKPPSIKENEEKALLLAYQNLIKLKWIDSAVQINDSLLFWEALKNYQNLHGLKSDGIIGKYTQEALSKSHEDRFWEFVLAVEKWKWKADTLSPNRIYVNIPQYLLQYYRNDSLIRVHNVIVGAPVTPTPEFSSVLNRFETYPFWFVPHSIGSTEIVALGKKNPQLIVEKDYIVQDLKNNILDPDSIQWSKLHENYFPYRVKQKQGKRNSLGIVKFLFPNPHDVYIHDTPGKWLFKNDVRAYSHGCIRLEHPVDFAKEIIDEEGIEKMNSDTLQVVLDSAFQKTLFLKKRRTVYIDYITTAIDPRSDSLKFYPDVYGRNQEYIKLLKERAAFYTK